MYIIYKTALKDALWCVPQCQIHLAQNSIRMWVAMFHPPIFSYEFLPFESFRWNFPMANFPTPNIENNILQHHHKDEALLKQNPLFRSDVVNVVGILPFPGLHVNNLMWKEKLGWGNCTEVPSVNVRAGCNFLNKISSMKRSYPKPSTMHCQKHFAPPKKDTSPGMWTTRR